MGGADGGALKAAPLLMGDRLHLTHHRGNAVTVLRVIAKIGMKVINPGIGIILCIIDHKFIHIGADLSDGDALFDDVGKVALNRNYPGCRFPYNDLHFPVLDVQPCLYQNTVLLHCRDDHRINQVHDIVMPALIRGRDVQAPVLCGCGRTDGKTFDILHIIFVCNEHLFYPVTDKLLHAALPLQIHIKQHIRIEQFHQRLIGNSL